MRATTLTLAAIGFGLTLGSSSSRASGSLTVSSVLTTAPLFNYEGAPATPDLDDPAIWINPRNHRRSLVVATAKDAGLLVYDLDGTLLQAIFPPNAPQVCRPTRRHRLG